ncbi:ribonuclease P protein subunit p29-like [Diadema setosum]|uniref:ribonuclease P protein subunit p29-like n=1 Tax=Diadema setosum TaxID=31175 RepID=UPI003B3A2A3C
MSSMETEEGTCMWLYRNLPQDITDDDSLVKPTADPGRFVTSFIKRHVPDNRASEKVSLVRRRDVISEGGKVRRKKPARKETSSNRKRGKKMLSTREKKKLRLFEIPPEQQKYELYTPLHQLWLDYMRETLMTQNPSMPQLQSRLLKCDLHGCVLTVTRSKCPSYVGTSGILLQETKNVFKIITKDDKLKVIPKSQCWFMFAVDQFAITIYGQHFCLRSSMRSAKKFKARPTIEL